MIVRLLVKMSAQSWATAAVGLLLWLCCTASGQMVTVSFQQPSYTVLEDEGSAAVVCVVTDFIFNTDPFGSVDILVDVVEENSTATRGVDFDLGGGEPVMLQFDFFGEQMQCVNLVITDDNLGEPSETFQLNLTIMITGPLEVIEASPQLANVTILDNDGGEPIFGFQQTTYNVTEGEGQVTVCAEYRSGPPTVQFEIGPQFILETRPGTAQFFIGLGPSDYFSSSTSCMFSELRFGDTCCLNITIIDDILFEPQESFSVILTSLMFADQQQVVLSPDTATVVIAVDNDPPVFDFQQDTYSVLEVEGQVTLCVEYFIGPASLPDSVTITAFTEDGFFGRSGVDYDSANVSLVFDAPVNLGDIRCLNITIIDNDVASVSDADFNVILTSSDDILLDRSIFIPPIEDIILIVNGTNVHIIPDNSDTIFQTVGFQQSQYVRRESGELISLCVVVEGLPPDGIGSRDVTLIVQNITATEGEDFTVPSQIAIDFNSPGTTCFDVDLINDMEVEGNETATISLDNSSFPFGAVLGQGSTNLIITDNDARIGFEQENYTVFEEDGFLELCVAVIEGDITSPVCLAIRYFTDSGPGSADFGSDFLPPISDFSPISRRNLACADFILPSPDTVVLELTPSVRRQCTNVTIASDGVIETQETFRAELMVVSEHSSRTVILLGANITIFDGSQECDPSTEFYCQIEDLCLPLDYICDGIPDCIDGGDERSDTCLAFGVTAACTEGDVQLVEGAFFRVEMCVGGLYRAVCSEDWDLNETGVVCRQMGMDPVGIAVESFSSFDDGVRLEVQCQGNESSLFNCQINDQDCPIVVGVECQVPEMPLCEDADLRLVGGENEMEGRVEMCYRGIWWAILDSDWRYDDAATVCRQLGFSNLDEGSGEQIGSTMMLLPVPIWPAIPQFGEPPAALFNREPMCSPSGTENRLLDCLTSELSQPIGSVFSGLPSDVVGVRCEVLPQTGCTEGEVRLVRRERIESIGDVQICRSNSWSDLCVSLPYWDNPDARVVCRQLGFEAQGSIAILQRSRPIPQDVFMFIPRCNGTESNLLECESDLPLQNGDPPPTEPQNGEPSMCLLAAVECPVPPRILLTPRSDGNYSLDIGRSAFVSCGVDPLSSRIQLVEEDGIFDGEGELEGPPPINEGTEGPPPNGFFSSGVSVTAFRVDDTATEPVINRTAFLPFVELDSGASRLAVRDDGSTGAISIPSGGISFEGSFRDEVYVGTNGVISFDGRVTFTRSPSPFSSSSFPEYVVAPFWEDVNIDQEEGGFIEFETFNSSNGSSQLNDVSNFVEAQNGVVFSGTWMIVVEWNAVRHFDFPDVPGNNTFQGIVISNGTTSYAVFTYRCGLLGWSERATIGFKGDDNFRNNLFSRADNANDIACDGVTDWNNVVYRIDVEAPSPVATVIETRAISIADAGLYRCVAENCVGNSTMNITINVLGPQGTGSSVILLLSQFELNRLSVVASEEELVANPELLNRGRVLELVTAPTILAAISEDTPGVQTVECSFVERRPIDIERRLDRVECVVTIFPAVNDTVVIVEEAVAFLREATIFFTLFNVSATGICNIESMDTIFGLYTWPETTGGDTAALPCELGPAMAFATRMCGVGGVWMDPDYSQCADDFDTLENVTVTADNYEQLISDLGDSVGNTDAADQTEDNIAVVSGILQDTAALVAEDSTVMVSLETVDEIVEILDILQEWNETVVATENVNIVQAFESIVSSYALQENFTELVVEGENLAFVVERLEVQTLIASGRGFSLAQDPENGTLDANTGGGAGNFTELTEDELATAFLPPSLFALFGSTDDVGVFFSLYVTAVLFPLGGEAQVVGRGGADRMVGSPVVAATVAGQDELRDLPDPVSILLRLNNLDTAGNITAITCVSYDFSAADGSGNWTSEGCETEVIDDGDGVLDDEDIVRCSCNHLTNFAALVDVCSRTGNCEISSEAQLALEVISIVGVVLSLIGIIITIFTLLAFKKLRQRDATKYHIQLCIALFCMLLVFVIGIDQTDVSEGCVTVSVLIHYFTLVAVMWMGAEATLMFQKLVIVFVRITTRYIIILSLVCWLVPIIPAVIPAAIEWEDVVTFTDSGDIEFCFIGDTAVFFGAFLGPILAVVAFNFVIFCIVVFILIRHTLNTSLRLQGEMKIDLETVIRLLISTTGVMFLFGLTWVFGALTVAEASLAFQILFALFNSFQGFFIFLFFVVFSKDAREAWKEILSCGRYTSKTLHPSRAKYTSSTPVLKSKSTTAATKITTTTGGASSLPQSEAPSGYNTYTELAAIEPGSTSTFGKGSTEKETNVDGVDGVKKDPEFELEYEKESLEEIKEKEAPQQASEAPGLQVGRESPGLKARVQRYSTKYVGKHHVESYEVDFEVGDDDDDTGFPDAPPA